MADTNSQEQLARERIEEIGFAETERRMRAQQDELQRLREIVNQVNDELIINWVFAPSTKTYKEMLHDLQTFAVAVEKQHRLDKEGSDFII